MPEGNDLVLLTKTEENKHIAVVAFNRPDAGNAVNKPMLNRFLDIFDEIEKDPEIRVMILHSAGPNSSFGADVDELVKKEGEIFKNISPRDAEQHVKHGRKVAERLFTLRPATIGIIHGFCLGGGAELYTCCDALFGASGGKKEGGLLYGFPEVKHGCMPGWMGPEFLGKLIGYANAKYLVLSGRFIKGEEALRLGIIQGLFPKDALMEEAMKWAREVAENAPVAVADTKSTVNSIAFPSLRSTVGSTWQPTVKHLSNEDWLKGVKKIKTGATEYPSYEDK